MIIDTTRVGKVERQDLVTLMKEIHERYNLDDILAAFVYCAEENSYYVGNYNEESIRKERWGKLARVLENARNECNVDKFWRSCWVCKKPVECSMNGLNWKTCCVWCSAECRSQSPDGCYD